MITFSSKGDFRNTERFLSRMSRQDIMASLNRYGREGVAALALYTPKDSGASAESWTYEIKKDKLGFSITWMNTNVVSGIPVVILLQYGHATGTGGYVRGRNFINPAIQPIFDRIADDVWKAVTLA